MTPAEFRERYGHLAVPLSGPSVDGYIEMSKVENPPFPRFDGFVLYMSAIMTHSALVSNLREELLVQKCLCKNCREALADSLGRCEAMIQACWEKYNEFGGQHF